MEKKYKLRYLRQFYEDLAATVSYISGTLQNPSAALSLVDDKSQYTDWAQREDIKAELKVDLILVLADNDYPPVPRDEVFQQIFEQAENFRKYQE